MITCLNCNTEFETENGLHRHLKAHDLSVDAYYQKYFPRKDLFTGEIINFKNKDQYFADDFNTRQNIRGWLDKQTPEVAKEYLKSVLLKRKEKGASFNLSQVELKSILSPPIQEFNRYFGDYYSLCNQLGFYVRHENWMEPGSLDGEPIQTQDISNIPIAIDTREQLPLEFFNKKTKKKHPTIVKTLKYGDYCLADMNAQRRLYIERKSLPDFIGTFGRGIDRFKKEIERSAESGALLLVMVECPYKTAMNFRECQEVSPNVKVTPAFIFHNVRELCQEFGNLQFLFVKDRAEASEKIMKLFSYKSHEIMIHDLEYLYNTGRF